MKQIFCENAICEFTISDVTPEQFSSIKVGLYIFLNLNSFKTKMNNLQIHILRLTNLGTFLIQVYCF